jgi:hypothetical protein
MSGHTLGYGRSNGVASTTMSEHEKHTEFLKQCIHYDESAGRQKLVAEIARIQCDMRCVQRAVWLMALLTALAVAALGYGADLVENFPYHAQQSIINLICGLGVGSLISFTAFVGLGMIYRWKLDQRREECRRMVTRLLESRLGKPVTVSARDTRNNRVGEGDGRIVRVVNEANGSPVNIESAAQG